MPTYLPPLESSDEEISVESDNFYESIDHLEVSIETRNKNMGDPSIDANGLTNMISLLIQEVKELKADHDNKINQLDAEIL